MRYYRFCVTLFLLDSILYTHDAHAYVDPGTGSYLLQILLASILAIFFGAKLFWRKIKVRLAELRKAWFGPKEERRNDKESK
jgi:membrane protease YdiL (CAAX protease family)